MARAKSDLSVDQVVLVDESAKAPQPDARALVERLKAEVLEHQTLDEVRRAYGVSLLDRLLNDLG